MLDLPRVSYSLLHASYSISSVSFRVQVEDLLALSPMQDHQDHQVQNVDELTEEVYELCQEDEDPVWFV